MSGLRPLVAVLLLAAAAPGTSSAQGTQGTQGTQRALVVQVAGANLYLDAGTDAGVRTGDTLAVRRDPTAAPVGAAVVIAATSARSVVTFVGRPFPATRGDTLYVTPGGGAAAAVSPARVIAEETRAPPRSAAPVGTGMRVDGALGLEMFGSHSETVGLGADPVRTTRDVGMPALRVRTRVANGSSVFNLNLRAQHRTGPPSLFERATRLRIYEARYDRTAGALKFSLGRFFSDFDHASGYWDGASVKLGDARGISGGVAAGFEPLRGNEEFSAEIPKVAAFFGARGGTERTDLATDLAVTQTLPRDAAQRHAVADWSFRMRTGRLHLAQELELSPPTPLGTWGISRFILRASTALRHGVELYGSAISDRPPVLDGTWTLPLVRRERLATGISYQAASGFYADLNGAINGPRDSTSGYSAGAMFAFPDLIESGSLAFHGGYFSSAGTSGVTASPSIEYRLRNARLRAGYQFFRTNGRAYSVTTHGADFRLSQSLSSRLDWVVQVNSRSGGNLRSTSAYSSFEVRF